MTQEERIVDRAMQMFVAQGIKSVRMDDIARTLGVSKRTLYELFGDKEHLLYLAMVRYFEAKRAGWQRLSAGAHDVLEQLFMVLCDVMDSSEESARMMDNLRKFYPAVHDRLMREGTENNRRELRSMLERGIAAGLFTSGFHIELAISVLYYTASALLKRGGGAAPARGTLRAGGLRADHRQLLPGHLHGRGPRPDRRLPASLRAGAETQITDIRTI